METILEVTSTEELKTAVPLRNIIPAGSKVDIQIRISTWDYFLKGSVVDMAYGMRQNLHDVGLNIDSIDNGYIDTTIHCTATRDIAVSDIAVGGGGQQAMSAGNIITLAIVAGIAALGITAGVTYIKISADITTQVTTQVDLVKDLAAKGYSASEISDILAGIKTPSANVGLLGSGGLGAPNLSSSTLIIIALVVGAILIIPNFTKRKSEA